MKPCQVLTLIASIVFLCSFTALSADQAGKVLLSDDFSKDGPVDDQKWEVTYGTAPACDGGILVGRPGQCWNSRQKFSEPVSVEFSGLFLSGLPRSSNNQLGFAPGGHGPDMAVWNLSGTQKEPFLFPYRTTGGQDMWRESMAYKTDLNALPEIAKPGAGVNLRVDWFPGKIARYYLNGKLVAAFTSNVPDVPLPVGVRDESVGYRFGSIKVTQITEPVDAALAEIARLREAEAVAKKQAEEAAARAQEAVDEARDKIILARINERVKALGKQFKPMRMVVGVPNYMWGVDPEIVKELKGSGMDVLAWPDAPLLNHAGNNRMDRNPAEYNIIVYGDTFFHLMQPDANTGAMPQAITKEVSLLKRFLEAGGGIWFCGLGEQEWGRSALVLNYMMKELNLDAEVIGESLKDTTTATVNTASPIYKTYAWVDVLPDPLTQGVANVLHPSGVIAGEGSMGATVIGRLGPDWRPLLRGRATSASYKPVPGVPAGQLQDTPGTVKSAPVLCAVRQAGKGRVVLWPTWSNFTVTGGSGGAVVDGEQNGQWSDGARLIENLMCWLAEPGQNNPAVGTFDPAKQKYSEPKVDIEANLAGWARSGRLDFRSQFKGLIGAHSNLSDGASSPEQMIAAAKQAGYQFIAFTEDITKLTEAKWKQLLEICDRTNAADANFQAFQGWDFMDEAGNRGIVFGHRVWLKEEWRSKVNPNCLIRWWYNLAYQTDANPYRWPVRVIIRSQSNNKRPWLQGAWSFLGVYCYEGGKLVDDSVSEWLRLRERHAFIINAGIMAVHTVRSAEEIAVSARPGLYQTYVRADNIKGILPVTLGCKGMVGYFPSYVSAGPEIIDFKCYAAIRGGENSFDLVNPENNHGVLHILAKSDAGLREVSVYQGERMVRRFLPEGNVFENFMTIHPDAAHSYTVKVVDKQGNGSVSYTAYLQIQDWAQRRSGDNLNWTHLGRKAGLPESEIKFYYSLHEVTHRWVSQEFLPAKERRAQEGLRKYLCEQGTYGNAGLSGAVNGYIRGNGLLVDGKPWIINSYPTPAITLDISTVGRFGSIMTDTVREEMVVPEAKPEAFTYGSFSGPYKVAPAPWPAALEQFIPFPKRADAPVSRFRGTVTFTNDISSADGRPIQLTQGATGNPGADTLEVMNADGKSKRYTVGEQTLNGEIPAGGYICWYDGQGKGLGGIISLLPGVEYRYDTRWQQCAMSMPSPAKAGTKATWDLIFVTGDSSTINTNQPMLDVWQGMGIAGKPSLYDVQARVGKVADQKFFLTLDSEDGGFSGRVVKTTGRLLPIHLPVFVKGVNPRWDAAIWYRGKSELHTPRYYHDKWGSEAWQWVMVDFLAQEDAVKYIPVLDGGRAYCQVETDKQDADVFIGNPLVCDQPEVFISVIKAEKGKCRFEVNNPLDKPVTVTVRPAKGFELVGAFEKKISLPAGGVTAVAVDLTK